VLGISWVNWLEMMGMLDKTPGREMLLVGNSEID